MAKQKKVVKIDLIDSSDDEDCPLEKGSSYRFEKEISQKWNNLLYVYILLSISPISNIIIFPNKIH